MNNIKLTPQEFVLLFGIEWSLQQHLDFLDSEFIAEETEKVLAEYNVEQMKLTLADIGYGCERFVCSTIVGDKRRYYCYDIDYIWEEGYELKLTEDGFIIMEECFPEPTIEYKTMKELEYAIK